MKNLNKLSTGIDNHKELVDEMAVVSKLPIDERIKLARNRRLEQLRRYLVGERDTPRKTTDHLQPSAAKVKAENKRKHSIEKKSKGQVQFSQDFILFEAAGRNDVQEVRQLLEARLCDKNATNQDGLTVLHQCCIDRYTELIHLLVEEFSVDVNKSDCELWTPLHTVALCGQANIAKYLIDHGANVLALNVDSNMPYDICDDDITLDVIESKMAKQGVTQEVIENMRMEREKNMMDDLKQISTSSGNLEWRGKHGETPLHVAAANGFVMVVKFLLDSKVATNVQDLDLWQPIHCAAKWKQLPVLELLLNSGADLTVTTIDGETPLDLCNDEEIQTWMSEAKKNAETENRSITSLPRQRNFSGNRKQNTGHMADNTISHYSSSVSLSEINLLSSSTRRMTTMEKENKTKKEGHEEFTGSLLSLNKIENGRTTMTLDENQKTKTKNHRHVNKTRVQDLLQQNGEAEDQLMKPHASSILHDNNNQRQPSIKKKSCLKNPMQDSSLRNGKSKDSTKNQEKFRVINIERTSNYKFSEKDKINNLQTTTFAKKVCCIVS